MHRLNELNDNEIPNCDVLFNQYIKREILDGMSI
jgi:hypothetical protein